MFFSYHLSFPLVLDILIMMYDQVLFENVSINVFIIIYMRYLTDDQLIAKNCRLYLRACHLIFGSMNPYQTRWIFIRRKLNEVTLNVYMWNASKSLPNMLVFRMLLFLNCYSCCVIVVKDSKTIDQKSIQIVYRCRLLTTTCFDESRSTVYACTFVN